MNKTCPIYDWHIHPGICFNNEMGAFLMHSTKWKCDNVQFSLVHAEIIWGRYPSAHPYFRRPKSTVSNVALRSDLDDIVYISPDMKDYFIEAFFEVLELQMSYLYNVVHWACAL